MATSFVEVSATRAHPSASSLQEASPEVALERELASSAETAWSRGVLAVASEHATDPDRLDSGTRPLRDQALLVAGVVVEDGTGAEVRADVQVRAGDSGFRSRTDDRGSFEFHTEQPVVAELSVEVSAYGYEPGTFLVPPGTGAVRLALRPRPRLLVTIWTDVDTVLDGSDVWLRCGEGQWRPFATWVRDGEVRCAFEVPPADRGGEDPVVQLDGRALPWAVTRAQWKPSTGGFQATLDLRGKIVAITLLPRVAETAVQLRSLFVRASDVGSGWVGLWFGDHLPLLMPRGVTLDAIALSSSGFPVHTRLDAGANVIDLPPPATIDVRAAGWPDGVRGRICLCQRTWDEPLLDELATAGVLDRDLAPQPANEAELPSRYGDRSRPIGASVAFAVVCRGRYRLVPVVERADGDRPLFDAAVEVLVATPGQRIDVSLRVDPERVRAAAR